MEPSGKQTERAEILHWAPLYTRCKVRSVHPMTIDLLFICLLDCDQIVQRICGVEGSTTKRDRQLFSKVDPMLA
ncbi:hypothetical protein BT67DRAFT_439364 [Trichocladium antarcticum]|uniref:Uncharacterized protein n=1 Tax=Trichocladium antarcticum TaxID=1450529 RepID=A0AAN6UR46_9PEZI|nr:hypothetical protein BT67DRAFT_439364 [Trichocladium antarcticum]